MFFFSLTGASLLCFIAWNMELHEIPGRAAERQITVPAS